MRIPRATGWLIVSLCLSVAAAAFAVGSSEAPAASTPSGSSAFPLTVTDDQGSSVTIARKPERIVSITLFTDEILVDLVDSQRLIAVTTFAADPEISNVATRVSVVPNKVTLAVEPILGLKPDLVFVSNWSEADKVKQLRDAGATVYLLGSGLTASGIQEKIRAVAKAVGESERGESIVATMSSRLDAVARKVATVAADRKLRAVDYATWGSAQGAGSSWDEIIRSAGLVNAVGNLQADQYGQVPLSKEKLLELDPDILVLPGWVYGDPKGAETFYRQTLEDPALKGMKAIREKRAFEMPERLKSTVSQYFAEAVEFLAKTAYPELFR